MNREEQIKEMREAMSAKCRNMRPNGDCPKELSCSQCEAEALYDAVYRKVDVDKLTRLPDKVIQEIVEKSDKEAAGYVNMTEGNFKQEDIEAIYKNVPWLVAQAQLNYTKKEIGE